MIQGAPSNQAVARVLELLSTNPDFREQMLGDPVSALRSQGIEADANNVPAVRQLPSMADVTKIHQEFLADPLGKSCIAVFIVVGAK